jgi:DNA ligase-1
MKSLSVILLLIASAINASPPILQLANIYREEINLQNYWVSEKYDGVRAYWNGSQFITRQGNIIHAPGWFTAPLVDTPLDGELWLARGKFDRLSGIIRRQSPVDSDWREIKYMVFDLPASAQVFDRRLQQLKQHIQKIGAAHIKLVEQSKIWSHDLLMQKLDQVISDDGEGLMLHLGSSLYTNTRSDALLKLKKHSDAEAVVIRHLPGKGKFKGMLGSVLVETEDGKRFKIGSGFSDEERLNPPPTGAIITYKYFGLTSTGLPRFASFVRVRNYH